LVKLVALMALAVAHLAFQWLAGRWLPRTRRDRALAIALGTPASYLLAAALILPTFTRGVRSDDRSEVVEVTRDAPAAGILRAGDVILESERSVRARAARNAPVELSIVRDSAAMKVSVTPREGRIGIQMRPGVRPAAFGEALVRALTYPPIQALAIGKNFVEVVRPHTQAELRGPVGMSAATVRPDWVIALELPATLTVLTGLLWLVADAVRILRLLRHPRLDPATP
jgi:hypothetical protein